jgi:DNA mismatch repair protein MutS
MDVCSVCGANGYNYPLDTHHIKEQNTFDSGDINKDKLSNLVVLCKTHHDEVHNGQLQINGYLDTVTGKKLDYNFNNNIKSAGKKKYNEEQIKMIKELAEELKDQKQFMKVLLYELKKKNINISAQTVNKICNGTY